MSQDFKQQLTLISQRITTEKASIRLAGVLAALIFVISMSAAVFSYLLLPDSIKLVAAVYSAITAFLSSAPFIYYLDKKNKIFTFEFLKGKYEYFQSKKKFTRTDEEELKKVEGIFWGIIISGTLAVGGKKE